MGWNAIFILLVIAAVVASVLFWQKRKVGKKIQEKFESAKKEAAEKYEEVKDKIEEIKK